MTSKAFLVAVVGATVIASASAYYSESVHSDESELLMENVEALAGRDEGGSSDSWACWSEMKNGSGAWRCGNPCEYLSDKNGKRGEGTCHK